MIIHQSHISREYFAKKQPSSEPPANKPRRRGRRSMAQMRAAGESGLNETNSDNLRSADSLGGRVRLARKRLGLSQQELADPQYVASYISAIERNKIHPSLKALELIAKRLGEPVEYFLYGGYGSGALSEIESKQEAPVPETNLTAAVRDNLLEAELLIEHGSYRGRAAEPDIFEKAAAILEKIPHHQLTEYDRAQTELLAGYLAGQRQDFEQAMAHFETGLLLASKTNQTELEVELHFQLGKIYFEQRQLELALTYHQRGQQLIAETGQPWPFGLILKLSSALTQNYLSLQQGEKALSLYEKILNIEQEMARPEAEAQRYYELSQYYRQRGDMLRARRYGTLALNLFEQFNRGSQVLRLSASISDLMADTNRLEEAERLLLKAVESASSGSEQTSTALALVLNSLAGLRLKQGRLEEARENSLQAIAIARKTGDILVESNGLRLVAEVEATLDHRTEARGLFEQAITLLEHTNSPYILGDVYKAYGETLSRWGDFEEAVSYLKKAYDSKR